jgi:hypothetical protein
MYESMDDLAHSISEEPGFIWKVWTENETTREAGGIYLFVDEESALAYLVMHTARLKGLGISEINTKVFNVNEDLSKITHAPLG